MPNTRWAMVFLARCAFWQGDHTVSLPFVVPAGHGHVGLHVGLLLPRVAAGELHHVVRIGQSLVQVAPAEGVVDDPGDVVLPTVVDDRGAGLQSLFRIEDRRQHLVLHLDEIERSLGRVDVNGRHGGYPVADVPGLVGEDVLILVLAFVGERGQAFGHHRARESSFGNVFVVMTAATPGGPWPWRCRC